MSRPNKLLFIKVFTILRQASLSVNDLFYFFLLLRTGKTLLAKSLARFVNVPFVISDATTLTQPTIELCITLNFVVLLLLKFLYSFILFLSYDNCNCFSWAYYELNGVEIN